MPKIHEEIVLNLHFYYTRKINFDNFLLWQKIKSRAKTLNFLDLFFTSIKKKAPLKKGATVKLILENEIAILYHF